MDDTGAHLTGKFCLLLCSFVLIVISHGLKPWHALAPDIHSKIFGTQLILLLFFAVWFRRVLNIAMSEQKLINSYLIKKIVSEEMEMFFTN